MTGDALDDHAAFCNAVDDCLEGKEAVVDDCLEGQAVGNFQQGSSAHGESVLTVAFGGLDNCRADAGAGGIVDIRMMCRGGPNGPGTDSQVFLGGWGGKFTVVLRRSAALSAAPAKSHRTGAGRDHARLILLGEDDVDVDVDTFASMESTRLSASSAVVFPSAVVASAVVACEATDATLLSRTPMCSATAWFSLSSLERWCFISCHISTNMSNNSEGMDTMSTFSGIFSPAAEDSSLVRRRCNSCHMPKSISKD
mmetsp:Transcript_94523/g.167409  ORF Transcript_94523/g.167409 Transcript_94523/m.167409 type:complete len:254 (+) Transcript_94523:362-1123(+)